MTHAQFDNRVLDLLVKSLRPAANLILPFYRRHPYAGRLWFTEVDMRVAVSLEYGFLYNRLPKNANSTVTAMLYQQVTGTAPETIAASAKHAFRRPSRLSARDVQKLPDLFKFCVVRDPYTRTLSAYLDKVCNSTPQARRPRRHLANEKPTFEQFCLYLEEGGLFDDNHWAPQVDGLVLPADAFDHVARFENIEAELQAISRRIFGHTWSRSLTYGPPGTSASDMIAQHYTERAHEIVSRLYAEDFAVFGYDR